MISNYLYSQSGYPRLIVYNGDTVAAVTRHQIMEMNVAHQTWIGCVEQNDSLLVILDSCTAGFRSADSAIHYLQHELSTDSLLIRQQSIATDTLLAIISDQKRTIRHLKVHRTLSTIGEGVLGVVIIWLLLR